MRPIFAILAFFGFVALCVVFLSVVIIRPGTCGVPVRFGAVANQTLDEGIHFITPVVMRVERVNLKIQKNLLNADAATKDLQDVMAEIAVNFNVVKEGAPTLFQTVGQKYFETVVEPIVMEVFKAEAAKFTAEELITERQRVSAGLFDALTQKMEPYSIRIQAISIIRFSFSKNFNAAIEDKIIAEQKALQSQRELEQVKYEAQQAEAKAKGEAAAILEKAKAEAEAIKIKAESVTTPVLFLEAINQWDGKLPTHLLGSPALPVANLTEAPAQNAQ